jgi:hypothetical protein
LLAAILSRTSPAVWKKKRNVGLANDRWQYGGRGD